ncbi:MAG: DUF58 domain-containing protein [Cycloclasticus sp.]
MELIEEQNPRVTISLKMLLDLAKKAPLVDLSHKRIRAGQSGEYLSRFKGRGMEFDETRIYQPGDDIRSIDWRVTARTNITHSKVFREEKERPVFISVDARPAMRFATRGVFKSVQAAKLAALLAWAAQLNGDRVGGQVFNEYGCQELKPASGKRAVLHFFNALVKPKPSTQIDDIPFDRVLLRLIQHARPGSLLYIISDFRGLNEQHEAYLAKLARHCEIVMIHLYDPLESQLPERGRYRFSDGTQELTVDSGDTSRVQAYHQQFQQRQAYLLELSKKWRMNLLQCTTTEQAIEVLS